MGNIPLRIMGQDMDDLLSEFLTETTESLDVVDVELVKFEQEPNNAAILNNIFRLVHTIKGTCGFLGLPRLEALAHAAETLMGEFRDGVPVTGDAVTLILESIDRIKNILSDLEENETEPDGSDEDLISKLEVMAAGGAPAAEEPSAPEPVADDSAAIKVTERETKPGEVSLDDLERAFQEAEGPDMDVSPAASEPAEEAKPEEPVAEPEPAPAKPPVEAKASDESAAPAKKKESLKNQSIRVNVDTLEHLITMVSELVLTRNQLLEMDRRQQDSQFKVPLQRLSNVTAELQEGIMQTRMQPIGNAWQKLPRIVRDLALELDKKIDLVMNGADTELDRQVLELIKDPLTHMVRNSADHGLETTQGRIDAGKPETGRVELSAYHEGGYIIMEIADDGQGLPTEKLKSKIIENGLLSDAEADKLTDAQVHRYVFNAGLSTAKNVTSVSGRGVGMDVVRSNIELIGGIVDLKSTPGVGTTFYIKIPLTLAIVSALIVEASGEKYAVPQLSVVELVRAQADSEHKIEMIKNTPVLRLRNKLLPLIHLSRLLEIEQPKGAEIIDLAAEKVAMDEAGSDGAPEDAETGQAGEMDAQAEVEAPAENPREDVENGFIIVTQVGSNNFGIVVDAVFHTEEIVVKPMSSMLRDISMFSGNTILGDGSVIMIIDPNGIVQAVSSDLTSEEKKSEEVAVHAADQDKPISMLLFKANSDEPKAVPLSLVTRLEEIKCEDIEHSNGKYMVQYRGNLMPLVYFDPDGSPKKDGTQPLLVFADNERTMAMAVDEIVDIVDEKLDIEVGSSRDGILGSAVIKGVATEVVDLGHYLPQAFADWFQRQEFDQNKFAKQILLVDDSAFFRNMLTPVLKAAGYNVTAVESARHALDLCEQGVTFDIIVSDIEMPEMNGFEFAEALAAGTNWADTPIIALSSHSSPAALERGRRAGFHDYVAKFDREGLIEILSQSHRAVGVAA
jgi:two-component system, chemotaxis family, sensor kinase CheA